MKHLKKWLSLMLVLCMVCAMVPAPAQAEETVTMTGSEFTEFLDNYQDYSGYVWDGTIPSGSSLLNFGTTEAAEEDIWFGYEEELDQSPFVSEEAAGGMLDMDSYNWMTGTFGSEEAEDDTAVSSEEPVADVPQEPEFAVSQEASVDMADAVAEDFAWTLENGVLTISGTGAMPNYGDGNAPWYSNYADITTVVIEEGLTSIGSSAFYGCFNMTSVTIPNTVTTIGESAFCSCDKLASVTIPDSVTTIGTYAFFGCYSLTEVVIPASVTTIEEGTFRECVDLTSVTISGNVTTIGSWAFCSTNLTSVTIPNTVTTIGDYAFFSCYSLAEVVIPASVTTIGTKAFYNCSSLTKIVIPATVTSMGSFTFASCGALKEAVFEEGVTSIPNNIFGACSGLVSVTIPNTVTTIGAEAFYNCTSLAKAVIPDSVTEMGTYVFGRCSSLTDVVIGAGMTTIPQNTFNGCSGLVSVTIPTTVTSIGAQAFANCTALEQITIPESVVTIEDMAFAYAGLKSVHLPKSATQVGEAIFGSCANLTEITVDPENPCITTVDNVLFEVQVADGVPVARLIQFPGGLGGDYTIPDGVVYIGMAAFVENTNLTSVTMPDSVVDIGASAFQGSSLTSVNLSNNLEIIEPWAFYFSGLTEVTLPASELIVDSYAFFFCMNLASLTIPEGVVGVGPYAFAMTSLTEVTLPASLTQLGYAPFASPYLQNIYVDEENPVFFEIDGVLMQGADRVLVEYPTGRTGGYVIPDGVAVILCDAFANATGLERLVVPAGVTVVDTYAFEGCTGLTDVYFYGDMPTFYDNAFLNVTANVYYPQDNTTWSGMGSYGGSLNWVAFDATIQTEGVCGDNLTWSVDMETGVLTISGTGEMVNSDYGWNNWASSIETIVVEEGVTTIGTQAFQSLTNVTSISLPSTLTTIGAAPFAGLAGLTSIDLPQGLKTIGDQAFAMSGLTSVTIPASVESVGLCAFSGCGNLAAIDVAEGCVGVCAVDGVLFTKDMTRLISYPAAKRGDYVIPDGVVSLDGWAFMYATYLTNVTIPDSVTGLGFACFGGCMALSTVNIPASVTYIEPYPFVDCVNLTSLVFEGSVPVYTAEDGSVSLMPMIYWESGYSGFWTHIFYPADDATWTEEALNTVAGNVSGMRQPYLPLGSGVSGAVNDTVNWKLDTSGTLTISGTGTVTLDSEGWPVYMDYYPHVKHIVIEEGIEALYPAVFAYMPNNLSVTTPSTLKLINPASFGGQSLLKDLNLAEGVEAICAEAFAFCPKIEEITIPASVGYIEDGTFAYDYALGEVTFLGNAPYFNGETPFDQAGAILDAPITMNYPQNNFTWYTRVGYHWGAAAGTMNWVGYDAEITWPMTGMLGLGTKWSLAENGTLTIYADPTLDTAGTTFDYDLGYHGPVFYGFGEMIDQIVIEEGVTYLGSFLFLGCDNVTEITIPASVTELGVVSLGALASLNKIVFLGDAPTFGADVFAGVTATVHYPSADANWPEEVKQQYSGTITWYADDSLVELRVVASGTVGEKDSWTLDNLGTLTISPNDVGETASLDLTDGTAVSGSDVPWTDYKSDIKKVVVTSGVTEVVNGAFSGCENLEEVELADTVTTIGTAAFQNCTALTEVIIPESVTTIADEAFSGCENLTDVEFQGDAPETGDDVFAGVSEEATITYPQGNETWTEDVQESVAGTIPTVAGMKVLGTITSYQDDAEAVTITLVDSEGNVAYQTSVVNNSADYTLTGVHAGTYTVQVSKKNHVTRSYEITVAEGNVELDAKIHLLGDVNGDGRTNVGDCSLLVAHVKGLSEITDAYLLQCGNLNGDKLVNVGDCSVLLAHVKGVQPLW